jgi:hypothetical protein
MADQKISAMPSAATLDGTEITPIVQAGANKQITTANYVAQVLNVHPATVSQGGTNLSSYTLGDTLYASGSTTIAKLAGNSTTTQKFLTQTGTGSASAAPTWKQIGPADINTQYGAFHFDFSTTLSQAATNTDTTLHVVTTSGFSAAGALIIGAEIITYTGITSTTFTGCTRGAAGSSNVSHSIGEAVNGAQTAVANNSTLLQLNSTDLSNGVTLNTSSQEVSVGIAGTYNFAFSAQFNNSATGQSLAVIWFAVNGIDVSNTASWVTIASRENSTTPGSVIMTANVFLTLGASDRVTMKWLTKDGHGALVTYPASVSPSYPAAPAVILTVNQVS